MKYLTLHVQIDVICDVLCCTVLDLIYDYMTYAFLCNISMCGYMSICACVNAVCMYVLIY